MITPELVLCELASRAHNLLLGGVMCSNYGATEVKSLTIYMGGPTYTRHHEQSLTQGARYLLRGI